MTLFNDREASLEPSDLFCSIDDWKFDSDGVETSAKESDLMSIASWLF